MLDCFDWATAEMRQRQSAVHQTELPAESNTNTYFEKEIRYFLMHVCELKVRTRSVLYCKKCYHVKSKSYPYKEPH